MDIERDAIGWRQILVGYGLVGLILGGTGAALLSTRPAPGGVNAEFIAMGAVALIVVADHFFRPAVERLFARIAPSPAAEFQLKIWAVGLLCVLSIASCAFGVAVSRAINA